MTLDFLDENQLEHKSFLIGEELQKKCGSFIKKDKISALAAMLAHFEKMHENQNHEEFYANNLYESFTNDPEFIERTQRSASLEEKNYDLFFAAIYSKDSARQKNNPTNSIFSFFEEQKQRLASFIVSPWNVFQLAPIVISSIKNLKSD